MHFSQKSASKNIGARKKTKASKRLQFIDDSSESQEANSNSSLTDSIELFEIDDEFSNREEDSEEEGGFKLCTSKAKALWRL